MVVSPDQAAMFEDQAPLKPYRNGKDLNDRPRNVLVIDCYGMTAQEVRDRFPKLYQWLFDRVKPERDANRDKDLREKWWLHRRSNEDLRRALDGLDRYFATAMVSKHRLFQALQGNVLPDQKLVAVGLSDFASLGILSSEVHVAWSKIAGARHGVGNDFVYSKTTCFDAFPFPVERSAIGDLAEHLDAHRKRQQAAHPELTLTGMYNVLEKLRSGEALTAKERTIHEQGLVSVLRQIHDDLDAAVLDAYGWSDLLPLLRVAHGNDAPAEGQTREDARRAFDEAVLERLVALNAERAAEEARGLVRWLRPDFQNPQSAPRQAEIDTGEDAPDTDETAPAVAVAAKPQPWPKDAVAQVRAVADVLTASPVALSLDDIAARFTARGPWKKRLPQLLEMLVAMGRAHEAEGRYRG
jgi:hypothetical protein